MFKNRLFTPGPTPIPHSVNLAMSSEMIHHRHAEFITLFTQIRNQLKSLFLTTEEVCIISGSGTASLEAIVTNFSNQSEVLVVNAGKFGERWVDLNKKFGNTVHSINLDWGQSVSSETVLKTLKENSQITHVFLTHSETSTGSATDIKTIADQIKQFNSNILVCVDGVTAVGAMEFRFDDWQIDLACTGSQKGLMMPPGLSFVAISKLAWKYYNDAHCYYFDLKATQDSAKKNSTPFTPAVSLLFGLHESLSLLENETIEVVWNRHQKLADATREAIKKLGLKLLSTQTSNALTAVYVPINIDGDELVQRFKSICGITIAGGQDHLKGKIFRISHLGYYDEFDIITVIAGLEKVLISFDFEFELGAGVNAAMKSFWK